MTKYCFIIYGKPHGKDRPRLCMQKGKDGKMRAVVYNPSETTRYESHAFQSFLATYPTYKVLMGPVSVEITAIYTADPNDPDGEKKMQAGAPAYNEKGVGYKRSRNQKKFDLDNICKIVLDAVQGCGHAGAKTPIFDDTQVVELHSKSVYGPKAMVKVTITALSEE